MSSKALKPPAHINTSPMYSFQLRRMGLTALVTLFASTILVAFLMPFAYMTLTSLKNRDQIVNSTRGTVLPVDTVTFDYEGETLDILNVPFEDGMRQLAILQRQRRSSTFIDPTNPSADPVVWEGSWRTLDPVRELSPRWDNYRTAWQEIGFPRLLFNTAFIAFVGLIGTLLSCISVAYAFARFPLPLKNVMFMVLIATIILPRQVMLVPTFAFFSYIGWTNTWLPLIVPHFFANAYNVFLLRQYFLQLPRELDEAAMIDGAGPFKILTSVIVPQSWPVIISVALFHLVFAWNDYFEPLIYTLGNPKLQPLAVGIQQFNFLYGAEPHLIQATALLGLIIPVLLFFFAQGVFMKGVVVTGVDK